MSVEEYKAPIRGIAKLILSLLAQLAKLFTNKIKDVEVRLMANGILTSASKSIEVLSDANENDAEQLRAVLNDLMRTGEFRQGAQAEILSVIQQLDNENIRKALTILNGHTFPIADILTDQNGENTEQIKIYMREVLASEDGMELFSSLLSIILPPAIASTLTILIIQSLMDVLLRDGDESAGIAVARLVALQQKHELKVA